MSNAKKTTTKAPEVVQNISQKKFPETAPKTFDPNLPIPLNNLSVAETPSNSPRPVPPVNIYPKGYDPQAWVASQSGDDRAIPLSGGRTNTNTVQSEENKRLTREINDLKKRMEDSQALEAQRMQMLAAMQQQASAPPISMPAAAPAPTQPAQPNPTPAPAPIPIAEKSTPISKPEALKNPEDADPLIIGSRKRNIISSDGDLMNGSATDAAKTSNTTGSFVGAIRTSSNAGANAYNEQNPTYTALKGQSFECALTTKVVSTFSGFFSCTLTENFYSTNGKIVLAERGSDIVGETSNSVRMAQGRMQLIGARLRTPNGVMITLDSPATDSLGSGGAPGEVNNHWGERIGGSLLLALINDGFALAQARKSEGSTVSLQGTQSNSQSLAGKLLDSTINIPPTITKHQGERVRIILARDLSFNTVYELRAAQ